MWRWVASGLELVRARQGRDDAPAHVHEELEPGGLAADHLWRLPVVPPGAPLARAVR